MTTGLLLKETMSGWLRIEGDTQPRDFAFSLRAFTPRIFSFTAPRAFRGVATLDGTEVECRGELTLHPSGPHYWLDMEHPELGLLHIDGKKQYRLSGLVHSLTTCPMTVYRNGEAIGEAQVAYRESMLAFPFKALRLAKEENAFGEYGRSV